MSVHKIVCVIENTSKITKSSVTTVWLMYGKVHVQTGSPKFNAIMKTLKKPKIAEIPKLKTTNVKLSNSQ